MLLGVDYYPEQWPDNLLEQDLDTIVELGSNGIRIGEFAWHLMEPEEGCYDFSYFDRVIDRAAERDLKVIFGTPTATIPAWLVKKHPDILSEFEDGRVRSFGGRHVYCFSSSVLYEYTEKIVRALVEHYKGNPHIVAWQIDNEIGHEGSDLCHCCKCRKRFREFLEEKFQGDINALNYTYGTAFWSQEYNGFDEIPIPAETITTHNPALRLDWERFRSKIIVDYINYQANLIRQIDPTATVMHDFSGGGLSKHVDFSKVAACIDKVAYNNYPVWGGQKEPIKPHEIGFALDYIRGLKGENFWITEAIMGAQGHDVTGFLPRPNQAKLWSYQGFAHGCDSMMYFRYRGATKGAEQFCYGVLDADNIRRRKFYEVQSFFGDISRYKKALSSPISNSVAIVYDYDSLASFRIQRQSILLNPEEEMKKFYKAFYRVNVGVDVIPEDRDFTGYKVIILPQMIVTKPDMEKKVRCFVEAGGTAVLTYRCGVKDSDNNIPFGKTPPVGYEELTGVQVVETESLQEEEVFPLVGRGPMRELTGTGGIFRDMLMVTEGEVLFRYGDPFYREFAAVVRKPTGQGMTYYIGCGIEEAIMNRLMREIVEACDIAITPSPCGVEIVRRGEGEEAISLTMNHNDKEVVVDGEILGAFECRIGRG